MAADGARQTVRILGLEFFNGTPAEAVAQITGSGGLLVAPSGTCFQRLLEDEDYRRAVTTADLALPDSGLMVMLWRSLRGQNINRISGLAHLKELLARPEFRESESALWVLPNESARARLLSWAGERGLKVTAQDCHVAPMYGKMVEDPAMLLLVNQRGPKHVVVAIGAGAQEKLGVYLRDHAACRPAIHCIGGALGFLTGDQVAIPDWADRLYLGWFFRLATQPRLFIPRLWKARVLPGLIMRYGAELPTKKKLKS